MKKTLSVLLLLLVTLSSFKLVNGSYTVNTSESTLKWTGYHLAKSYEHWGYVNLKSGTLAVKNGKITAGEFIIDMTTIANEDVDGEDGEHLDDHLKNEDFFAVADFPEAKLVIKSTNTTGQAIGDLTIRGITKEINFDIQLSSIDDNELIAKADLKVDRTDFKVMYGWKIENAVLSNEFRMQVEIVAKK